MGGERLCFRSFVSGILVFPLSSFQVGAPWSINYVIIKSYLNFFGTRMHSFELVGEPPL